VLFAANFPTDLSARSQTCLIVASSCMQASLYSGHVLSVTALSCNVLPCSFGCPVLHFSSSFSAHSLSQKRHFLVEIHRCYRKSEKLYPVAVKLPKRSWPLNCRLPLQYSSFRYIFFNFSLITLHSLIGISESCIVFYDSVVQLTVIEIVKSTTADCLYIFLSSKITSRPYWVIGTVERLYRDERITACIRYGIRSA